jgi:arylsulfotransferase ASST
MNKKILTIGITVLFLLTSMTIISTASIKKLQNSENINIEPAYDSNNQTGVITYKDSCCEGYTLCSVVPFMLLGDGHHALLIDMDGNQVNKWFTIPDPAKMLPGGSVISATGEYYESWDSTNLTQLDWDGNVEWDFSGWDDDGTETLMAREHHDFQREGNPVGYYAPGQDFVPCGKTLILAHNTTYNPNVSRKTIIDDVIYEVYWNGTFTGFEWHASDHIDEMGFDSKARKGIWLNPGGPGLILGCLPGDWIHINSMSLLGKNRWYYEGDERFNPENIIISSRHANFIAIISRETGEIIWRVGPDFSKNTEEGRKLGQMIGLHHAHIIPDGLPGAGNILLFDNGGIAGYGLFGLPNQFRFYSRILEFDPITLEIVYEYSHKKGLYPFPRNGEFHRFFSTTLCSTQRLPNGNTLIIEGLSGRVFEITPDNEIVWDFVTPDVKNYLYRAYRIPPEWVPGNPANYKNWGDNSSFFATLKTLF